MKKEEARNKIIKYCQEIDWYAMHISDIEKGIDKILDEYGLHQFKAGITCSQSQPGN